LKTVRPSGILKIKKQKTMNKYQDKEASMDDYSHEKKLKALSSCLLDRFFKL